MEPPINHLSEPGRVGPEKPGRHAPALTFLPTLTFLWCCWDRYLSRQTDWAIIHSMPDADFQPSGNPIPGESPEASLPIPWAYEGSDDPRRSTSEYLQPPRLGIIHLLALMTVTAVFLTAFTPITLQRPLPVVSLCIFSFNIIVKAAGFIGAYVLLRAIIRHTPGCLQPGHCMLLFGFVETLGTIINWIVYNSLQTSFGPLVLAVVITICESAAYFWCALRIPERGRWKLFFRLWAVAVSLPAVLVFIEFLCHQMITGLSPFSRFPRIAAFFIILIMPLIILFIVLLIDIIRGCRRDWLHWLGVCIFVFDTTWMPIILLVLE